MNEHKEYLTKYIQSLPSEALDRIVEAQDWIVGDIGNSYGRCLVGHTRVRCPRVTQSFDSLGGRLWTELPFPIDLDHPAVQFVKKVAAEEIEKRADTVIANANLPDVVEPVMEVA